MILEIAAGIAAAAVGAMSIGLMLALHRKRSGAQGWDSRADQPAAGPNDLHSRIGSAVVALSVVVIVLALAAIAANASATTWWAAGLLAVCVFLSVLGLIVLRRA